MLIYPCIGVYIEQAPLRTISSVWVCYLPLHIRCSSVLALQMSLSPADAAFCCRSLQVLCNKQQIGQLFVCAPVLKAEWLQAHAPEDDPASKTARARGLAKRMQEAECLLISLINQLDPEGRAHAYANRPQQPHVTGVSALASTA